MKKNKAIQLVSALWLVVLVILSGCMQNAPQPDPGQNMLTPSPEVHPTDEITQEIPQSTPPVETKGTPAPTIGETVPTPGVTAIPSQKETSGSNSGSMRSNSGTMNKVKVKGLYLTGWTAGSEEKMNKFIRLAEETEINAFVIDIKNEDGIVSYESGIATVKKNKVFERMYDPKTLIKTLHDKGIYVIGRVVCFCDPAFSKKMPAQAIKNTNGELWKENKKDAEITWLNPYDKRNWSYLLSIAKEAAAFGFDEIQFDYVRFPNGDRSTMDFGATGITKYEVINEFLSHIRKEMPNVTLSADIFGIVCVSPKDHEDIGQYLELIGKNVDYISPMTYPSLYARGQIVNGVKFHNPDLEPYEVVYQTLLMAKDRLSKVDEYRAEVRPFIQAYTASWLEKGSWQKYSAKQYRQQIQAVLDAGYEQWIFWDANNQYDFSAFKK